MTQLETGLEQPVVECTTGIRSPNARVTAFMGVDKALYLDFHAMKSGFVPIFAAPGPTIWCRKWIPDLPKLMIKHDNLHRSGDRSDSQ
jgi:hypothetical protein